MNDQRPPQTPVTSAQPYIPNAASIAELRRAAQRCRGCLLYVTASQALMGEGPEHAAVVVVGEQPGHDEDLAGKVFQGAEGRVLNAALARAGIARDQLYLTYALKHFKWAPHGKRRQPMRPKSEELAACAPWLHTELSRLRASVVVCLGEAAARSVLGVRFAPNALARGWVSMTAPRVLLTLSPYLILKSATDTERQSQIVQLAADLEDAWAIASATGP